ncbi:MAG: hypothetical protein B7Z74_11075 [Deltaproteobacteria bacterium 21-66-5]|nr:MAG: hypothetical protein B7Z74_11075 [Deltaproteobacteria bacterium 21-66-5]
MFIRKFDRVEKEVGMKDVTVQETPACSCGDICTMASRRVFRVEGMDCAHESTPILAALSTLPGVGRAVPSYSDSTLAVEFDPHAVWRSTKRGFARTSRIVNRKTFHFGSDTGVSSQPLSPGDRWSSGWFCNFCSAGYPRRGRSSSWRRSRGDGTSPAGRGRPRGTASWR